MKRHIVTLASFALSAVVGFGLGCGNSTNELIESAEAGICVASCGAQQQAAGCAAQGQAYAYGTDDTAIPVDAVVPPGQPKRCEKALKEALENAKARCSLPEAYDASQCAVLSVAELKRRFGIK